MADHFQDIDTDGDGKVSMNELKAFMDNQPMTTTGQPGFYKEPGFIPNQQIPNNKLLS